jgi:hypothetical protein
MRRDVLREAVVELVRLITQRGASVRFRPPGRDGDGGAFTAARLQIEVYKERTTALTPKHVYCLAHEYRHLCQYLAMDGANSWLFDIDCTCRDDKAEDARLELDADKWAASFMSERKIKLPATLRKFIDDRHIFYQDVLDKEAGV